jgi:hypothetical protein
MYVHVPCVCDDPLPTNVPCPVSRIKTETGTSIIIPPDTERNDVIRIEGDPVGVKAAKNMLLELASKMVSAQAECVMMPYSGWSKFS